MDEKLQKLYRALSAQYNMPDYDAWQKSLSDPAKLQKAYDFASQNFNNVGSIDDFRASVFPVKKKESGNVSGATSSSANARTAAQGFEPAPFSWSAGEQPGKLETPNYSTSPIGVTPSKVADAKPIVSDTQKQYEVENPPQEEVGTITSTGNLFHRGFYNTIGASTIKGVAELAYANPLANWLLGRGDAEESWTYQAGKALEDFVNEATPVDEDVAESIPGQIAQGLGQAAAMIATMPKTAVQGLVKTPQMVGGAKELLKTGAKQFFSRPAVVGALQTVSQEGGEVREAAEVAKSMTRDEYIEANSGHPEAGNEYDVLTQTDPDELAAGVVLRSLPAAFTEAVPLNQMFNRLDKLGGKWAKKRIGQWLTGVATGTAEGATQEMLQEAMTNVAAQDVYAFTSELTDGLEEAATVGGGVQLILEGVLGALGAKRANVSIEEQSEVDRAIELVQDKQDKLAENLSEQIVSEKLEERNHAEAVEEIKSGKPSTEALIAASKDIEGTLEQIPEENRQAVEEQVNRVANARNSIPQDLKDDPDVIEATLNKQEIDQKIAALKEEIKGRDEALVQDKLDELKLLEIDQARASILLADAADVKPSEKAEKTLEQAFLVNPDLQKQWEEQREAAKENRQKKLAAEDVAPIISETTEKTPETETKKRRVLTERAYEGDVDEAVKAHLEEKGLYRDVVSQEQRSAEAQEFIDKFGEDVAVQAIQTGRLTGAVASSTLAKLIKSTDDQMAALDPNDKEGWERLSQKSADLIELTDKKAFEGGEFNSQLHYEYQNSGIKFNTAVKKKEYEQKFGQALPQDVEAKFRALDEQMRELNKKLKEAEAQAKAVTGSQAVADIQEANARQAQKPKKDVARASKQLADKLRKGKIHRPGIFSSASPASLVWDGAIEVTASAIELSGNIAQAIQDGVAHIKQSDWYKSLTSKEQREAEQAFVDAVSDNRVGNLKIPEPVLRDFVAQGITDIDALVEAVRGYIGDPDLTDREIRDGITQYGKTINMKQDEVSKTLRRLKRIGTTISKLEDVRNKKRPLRSGLQRDKLDAEERSLQKQLREEMKDLPVDEETEARELKTALDAAKNRLRNQIEDLEREIETREQAVTTPRTAQEDAELKDLREKRDKLKEEHDNIFKNEEFKEAKRLELAKKRTDKLIENLERKIKEKDFSKKTRTPIKEDAELTALRAKKLRLQEEYDKEFHKAELKARTTGQQVRDALWDAWGLTRALGATADASFMLMQGGLQSIAHPTHAAKAIKDAAQAFWSKKKVDKFIDDIRGSAVYPIMKASKLAITEPSAQLTAREELFFSGWTDNLWNFISYAAKPFGDKARQSAKEKNPFRMFERAAAVYLDTLRMEGFAQAMEVLEGENKTIQSHPQEYKDAADMINTLTGRASLGSLERHSETLSKIFFSPRLWSSQLKQTILAPWYFSQLSPTARRMALADYGKYLATITATMVLLATYLNADDDDETGVEFDPRSTDFMKVKLGDTRIDPWGGRIQQVIMFSKLFMDTLRDINPDWSEGGQKTKSGEIVPLGTRNKSNSKGMVLLQMAINKLSPSAHILENYLASQRRADGTWEDAYGNDYSLSKEIWESLSPIFWRTTDELLAEDPNALNGFLVFLSFLGVSVNKYEKKEKKGSKAEPGVTIEKN